MYTFVQKKKTLPKNNTQDSSTILRAEEPPVTQKTVSPKKRYYLDTPVIQKTVSPNKGTILIPLSFRKQFCQKKVLS